MIAKIILEIMKIQPHQITNIISGLPKGSKCSIMSRIQGGLSRLRYKFTCW
jgi:GTP1/Obg family GTP-binding protein